MGRGADGTQPLIDVASLEVRRRYRVDWTHERLRRTFRFTGTLVSIEMKPATSPGDEPERWLIFEVKPRFGQPTLQRVDVETLRSIEPA